ncbi:MAG: hypothetical protein ACRCUQ_02910 [Alphaproteobacteria bacterium]
MGRLNVFMGWLFFVSAAMGMPQAGLESDGSWEPFSYDHALKELKENWESQVPPAPPRKPTKRSLPKFPKAAVPEPTVTSAPQPKRQKSAAYADEGLPPEEALLKLTQALEIVKRSVEKGCHPHMPDWELLLEANRYLKNLTYQESVWETYAKGLNATRWPLQETWKQVVGGHLFFPAWLFDWEHKPYEAYKQRRNDTLWSCAVAAKHKHPLAAFFLSRELETIRSLSCRDPKPVERLLFKMAVEGLKQAEKTPEVCYVLGVCYERNPDLTEVTFGEPKDKKTWGLKNAVEWLERGNDRRSQFEALEIKSYGKASYPTSPSADDYLALARSGYLSAYVEAASRVQDEAQRRQILEEAVEKGDVRARLQLAADLKKKGFPKEARTAYRELGQRGISQGYLELGLTYIGEIDEPSIFEHRTPEDIAQVIQAFTLAGNMGDPRGWEHLVKLYEQLREQGLLSGKPWAQQFLESFKRGARLGVAFSEKLILLPAYKKFLYQFLNNSYEGVEYFQHDLSGVIEDFFNEGA